MPKAITFIFLFVSLIHLANAQSDNQIIIGTEHILYSDTLKEDRVYWINLPESYDRDYFNYKRYPILIILDGHAHFKSISRTVNYLSTGYNGYRR